MERTVKGYGLSRQEQLAQVKGAIAGHPLYARIRTPEALRRFMERPRGPRSWRRPPPSASVRRKSTSWSKEQGVQGLRLLSLQYPYKGILYHTKIYYICNYLIFLTLL